MHLLVFLTACLHDIIKGKRRERDLLQFTFLPTLHQARELIFVSVVRQVRVAARSPVDDPGPVPSRWVQGGAVQVNTHVPSTGLISWVDEEQPRLRVWRQERRAASFAVGLVVGDEFGGREANDAALAAWRGFDQLCSDVGFVKIKATVFTQGLTPVAPRVACITVEMAPALVIDYLRHFTLTRLFSKHFTNMPCLAKVLAIYRQRSWADGKGNGKGEASVRDIIGVRWDDQPPVLQLNAVTWTHCECGPPVDSLANCAFC